MDALAEILLIFGEQRGIPFPGGTLRALFLLPLHGPLGYGWQRASEPQCFLKFHSGVHNGHQQRVTRLDMDRNIFPVREMAPTPTGGTKGPGSDRKVKSDRAERLPCPTLH